MIQTVANQLLNRIQAQGPGSVFATRDFHDLGPRKTVNQALSRLAHRNGIRRVARGIYDYPRQNDLFGQLSPSADAVALALARSSGSQLQVSGARAANILGLSYQVPARTVYLTDGPSKQILVGKQKIDLRHAPPDEMIGAGRVSGVVLQALRYMGHDYVDDRVVKQLKDRLSDDDKAILSADAPPGPDWLRHCAAIT